jgi:hypothetical protein
MAANYQGEFNEWNPYGAHMIVIGCDPGLTGAITSLDHHGHLRAVIDLPTCSIETAGPKAKVKRKIDARALREIMRGMVPADERAIFAIEDMQLLGGSSVQTMGALAHTRGVIEAVALLCDLDVRFVRPQAWKRFYGLGSDKMAALNLARTLWGGWTEFSRVKDHNRAESALIARWALRNLT